MYSIYEGIYDSPEEVYKFQSNIDDNVVETQTWGGECREFKCDSEILLLWALIFPNNWYQSMKLELRKYENP